MIHLRDAKPGIDGASVLSSIVMSCRQMMVPSLVLTCNTLPLTDTSNDKQWRCTFRVQNTYADCFSKSDMSIQEAKLCF